MFAGKILPPTGRFTSYDKEEGSISNFLDINRYVYCKNNPVRTRKIGQNKKGGRLMRDFEEFAEMDIEDMTLEDLEEYKEAAENKYDELYDNEPDGYDDSHDEWEDKISEIEELLAELDSRISELE